MSYTPKTRPTKVGLEALFTGTARSVVQPYIVVRMWQRSA
jgi:hypothetical protein